MSSGEFSDEHERKSNFYPTVFPISVTHTVFPSNATLASDIGLPLGCFVNAFIPFSSRSQLKQESSRCTDDASLIARCDNCNGYINPFCVITQLQWLCSLCGCRNVINKSMKRYRHVDVRKLIETKNPVLDLPLPYRDTDGVRSRYIDSKSIPVIQRPMVHIFLIQESISYDCLQTVIDGISEAINKMHPDIQIVILSFSNRIGLYNLVNEDDSLSSNTDCFHKTNQHYSTSTISENSEMKSNVKYVDFADNDGKGKRLTRIVYQPTKVLELDTKKNNSNNAPFGTSNKLNITEKIDVESLESGMKSPNHQNMGTISTKTDLFSSKESTQQVPSTQLSNISTVVSLESVGKFRNIAKPIFLCK